MFTYLSDIRCKTHYQKCIRGQEGLLSVDTELWPRPRSVISRESKNNGNLFLATGMSDTPARGLACNMIELYVGIEEGFPIVSCFPRADGGFEDIIECVSDFTKGIDLCIFDSKPICLGYELADRHFSSVSAINHTEDWYIFKDKLTHYGLYREYESAKCDEQRINNGLVDFPREHTPVYLFGLFVMEQIDE